MRATVYKVSVLNNKPHNDEAHEKTTKRSYGLLHAALNPRLDSQIYCDMRVRSVPMPTDWPCRVVYEP